MAEFTLEEIIAATGGALVRGDLRQAITGISTDSRQVGAGDLFIALKGERFDGHDFLAAAAHLGAAALMGMDDLPAITGVSLIKVPDTLKALGDIARFHRQRFSVPVIGITGSNGKTTTKDLVASILCRELTLVKTEANYNNEIGLPLTLLKISRQTQAVVVEMGMRGLGQIRHLAEIAGPNYGLITNVGLTHLELLKSQQNIGKAKAELVESLPANGLAVLNGDDPLVRGMRQLTKARTVLYGIEGNDLNYRAGEIEVNQSGSRFVVHHGNNSLQITLPVPGRHNILNATAAVVISKELGIPDRSIQKGLAEPVLTGKRLHIIEKNGYHLIDDTYNASPTSVKAALDVLTAVEPGCRKIAVLADMLELGTTAAAIHYETGAYAGKTGVNCLFAFGDLAKEYVKGMNDITKNGAEFFSSKQALIDRLKEYIKPGDFILVKGSRGMKMEEIVTALTAEGVNIS